MSTISNKSSITSSSEDDNNNNHNNNELRRGPWTMEEDTILTNYIACNGEGRWNFLAKHSGLRRTGKSCRLRWLNYLKPDVKRGNLTPEEQLLILDLHSKWGNRWSKIAQFLPGRTDNEIKNYWRTRVQKQAKHLKIDTESAAFQDIIRRFWMPRLKQKILGSSSSASLDTPSVQNPFVPIPIENNSQPPQHYSSTPPLTMPQNYPINEHSLNSESLTMSDMFQFSEYPNCSSNNLMVNSENNGTSLFDSFSCGMDVYGHPGTSFSEPQEGFENQAGVCHVAGGDWADNDFFGSVWTMGEF